MDNRKKCYSCFVGCLDFFVWCFFPYIVYCWLLTMNGSNKATTIFVLQSLKKFTLISFHSSLKTEFYIHEYNPHTHSRFHLTKKKSTWYWITFISLLFLAFKKNIYRWCCCCCNFFVSSQEKKCIKMDWKLKRNKRFIFYLDSYIIHQLISHWMYVIFEIGYIYSQSEISQHKNIISNNR